MVLQVCIFIIKLASQHTHERNTYSTSSSSDTASPFFTRADVRMVEVVPERFFDRVTGLRIFIIKMASQHIDECNTYSALSSSDAVSSFSTRLDVRVVEVVFERFFEGITILQMSFVKITSQHAF